MTHDSAATASTSSDPTLDRLKRQRDFRGHLIFYLLVNTSLVVIWALTSHGFFWPAFPMVGWGIGVAMNAWEAYGRRDASA